MIETLKVNLIFWEDILHQDYTSVNFCDRYYHKEGTIERDEVIYDLITSILYFDFEDEDLYDTEETFKPHNIIHKQEISGKYFDKREISEVLKNITIN